MEKLRVADAITEVFTIFKRCNKYIDETMPWALAKDESKQDRLATVLYNLVEGICMGTTLLESFMPDTTKRILAQLNASERTLEDLEDIWTVSIWKQSNRQTGDPFCTYGHQRSYGKSKASSAKRRAEKKKEDWSSTLKQSQRSHLMILQRFSSRLVRSLPARQ